MKRILVADDDALIGMLLATMLQDMNFDVCTLETTERGTVEAALRLRPDLMIVDARLGRGSGLAAVAEIERHMTIPNIFMSGDRLPPAPNGAPALLKPFTMQGLERAIRQVLDGAAGQMDQSGGEAGRQDVLF
jgi:DNA-binding response OmpR family regulator